MIHFVLALVYSIVVWIAVAAVGARARSSRLAGVVHRAEIEAPRRRWGSERDWPPASHAAVRGIAMAGRLVRSSSLVAETSGGLRRASRSLSLLSTVSALSLVPFAGTWGERPGNQALVVVDLEYGLGVVVFLILLAGLTRATAGLSERSLWARLGALRIAGRSLIGVALLLLVLAPLVLATSSLRLVELVHFQHGTFAPLGFLAESFSGFGIIGLDRIRLPNWFVWRQPLTAILVVPTLGLLARHSSVYDRASNTASLSGTGFDADPNDLYWMGLESRLSSVLAGALFVSLFLGAGDIPYFDSVGLMQSSEPYLGHGVSTFLLLALEVGVFVAKLILMLHLGELLRRTSGRARTDQSLRTVTRRMIPLAWANLLILSALFLLSDSAGGMVR